MTDNAERDLELAAIEQKADRGERLTKDDRVALWAGKLTDLEAEFAALLKAGKIRTVIMDVMTEIASVSVVQNVRRDELEARVAALENAAKPRKRVKANIRLIA